VLFISQWQDFIKWDFFYNFLKSIAGGIAIWGIFGILSGPFMYLIIVR
jgi:hypothetical protein